MSKQQIIEDTVGIAFGLVGGAINKYFLGIKLFVIMEYLPEAHSFVSSIVTAGFCAAVGFVVTRSLHWITKKFKSFSK